MHIGLAGPIDMDPLRERISVNLPGIYRGPCTGWLARTWLEQGHQVTIYALSSETGEREVYEGDALKLIVVPQRSRAVHRARDLFRVERRSLMAAMRDYPAELVSAHWTYEFALAAIHSGIPAFVTAHDTPLRYAWEMRSAYRWMRHSLSVPVVHRAHALSANSPYTANHLRRCLGVRRPVKVIPNGVDISLLQSATHPPGPPVFACALQGWGRLKNAMTLLRAFADVREQFPAARLLLFGDGHGPTGPAYEWAATRILTVGVEFVGLRPHQEVLDRIASEAHVLIHPSRVESFSMITAEAMGMGLPVVVGTKSGAVEWVAGEGGLATDVRSARSLASVMRRVAGDPELRLRLGSAGRKRVTEHFELRRVATAYTSWFSL
ncbi:glycosyltransferase family 4 protein [Streptomyces sioyaensis]|uniref:glycosyltransferase family 4 protein n=1 Tax=Streptomyces sioyaensis TaxID=67364 RepID=UPI003401D71B